MHSSKHGDNKVIHEKTFKIDPNKKIILNTDAGDIQITPWNKAEVYVKVIGNDNARDKYDYNFNSSVDEINIDVEKKGGLSWFSNINLKFEIKYIWRRYKNWWRERGNIFKNLRW